LELFIRIGTIIVPSHVVCGTTTSSRL